MAFMTNAFRYIDKFVLKWIVRLSIQVPKTSKFKELKNKPLKLLREPFCNSDTDLQELFKKIKQDPNLKCAGVTGDIAIILRCLFDDKEELLVATI